MTHRLLLRISGTLLSTAMLGSCGEPTPMGLLPAGLAVSSGDEQSGTAGQPLQQPLVVTLAEASGRAVGGAQIRWEVISGGGAISSFTYTDVTGRASATWTLGLVGRTQTVLVSVPSSSVIFTATANGAATELVLIAGDGQAAIIDDTLPVLLRVRATNDASAGVAGVTVIWAATGGGQASSSAAVTDALGEAVTTWVLGPTLGTQAVTATVTGLIGSPVQFTATANAATNTLSWAIEGLPPICPCPSGTWGGIWVSSPSNVFAVGGRGTIRHFNGSSWEAQNSGTANSLEVVSGNSPSDVFAGGFGAILHYDGASWSPLVLGSAPDFWGMWGSSPSDEFAVGYGSGIWHYDGSVWIPQTNTSCLVAVWGSSGRDVFAVGGLVSHYDGTTWSNQNSGNCRLDSVLSGVWGSGPADVYAVGYAGCFQCSASGTGFIDHYDGTSWTRQLTSTEHINAVWGASSAEVVAVGSNGLILHYDGMRWRRELSGTTEPIVAVSGSSARDVWAITVGGRVLHGTR
jgi:hypothetical protein